jgi:hypothetical protein
MSACVERDMEQLYPTQGPSMLQFIEIATMAVRSVVNISPFHSSNYSHILAWAIILFYHTSSVKTRDKALYKQIAMNSANLDISGSI